jgi:hypothetical protein
MPIISIQNMVFPFAHQKKKHAASTFRPSGAAGSNVGPREANDGRCKVFGEGLTTALATKFRV